jgi:hypothetical protein
VIRPRIVCGVGAPGNVGSRRERRAARRARREARDSETSFGPIGDFLAWIFPSDVPTLTRGERRRRGRRSMLVIALLVAALAGLYVSGYGTQHRGLATGPGPAAPPSASEIQWTCSGSSEVASVPALRSGAALVWSEVGTSMGGEIFDSQGPLGLFGKTRFTVGAGAEKLTPGAILQIGYAGGAGTANFTVPARPC